MSKMETLHREAIELADQAEVARLRGHAEAAQDFLRKAYAQERKAALEIVNNHEFEPTRSVLLRSAASFALECREIREAERLVSSALAGSPPDEIADELRDLLEQVHFERHLVVRGLELAPNELQFSMTGEAIGLGFARSSTFGERADSIEKALFRTAERILKKPYRDRGRRERALKDRVEIFVSAPRAASFAVTFRLGHSAQVEVPGASFGEQVVDDLLDLLDMLDRGETERLSARVPEPAYLRNFVGLAKKIVPDGQAVKMVGFTTRRVSGPRTVALRATRDEIEETSQEISSLVEEAAALTERKKVTFEGRLLFADEVAEEKSAIKIVEVGGRARRIRVPAGMMADIVSPMWEQKVRVRAIRDGSIYVLEDIRRLEEP